MINDTFTPAEMLREYRSAANKRKEFNRLMDLTCCSADELREVLLDQGLDPKELPRNRKKKEPHEPFALSISVEDDISASDAEDDPVADAPLPDAATALCVSTEVNFDFSHTLDFVRSLRTELDLLEKKKSGIVIYAGGHCLCRAGRCTR